MKGIAKRLARGGKLLGVVVLLLSLANSWNSNAATPQISAAFFQTVGLKSDGTVVGVGLNDFGQVNVSSWTDIVQISSGPYRAVGLKSDGTVIQTMPVESKYWPVPCYTEGIYDWDNIEQVIVGSWDSVVGLRSDGTVVTAGYFANETTGALNWTDIKQVASGVDFIAGLKSDGTVVVEPESNYPGVNAPDWENITKISAGIYQIVGLKSDGTVVAFNQFDNSWQSGVSSWTDIVDVAAGGGDYVVGLKSDGTVVAVGRDTSDPVLAEVSGWNNIIQVSAGYEHIVGLKSDGSIVAVGSNGYGQISFPEFTNTTQFIAGSEYTVGVKTDGTVVSIGDPRYSSQEYGVIDGDGRMELAGWDNIIQVDTSLFYTVGLKADGTVITTRENLRSAIADWGQIKQVVAAGDHARWWSDYSQAGVENEFIVGLRSNGTVVSTSEYWQSKISDWINVDQIASSGLHIVALKFDGTVIATGSNNYGETDLTGWTDISQVVAGINYTIGLKSDGTVVVAGINCSDWSCEYKQFDFSDWTDIFQIAASDGNVLGLKSDGTVVAAGHYMSYGYCYFYLNENIDISNWTDIVQISTSYSHRVGLKSDGTLVGVGDNGYSELLFNNDWRLKVGVTLEDMPQAIEEMSLPNGATTSLTSQIDEAIAFIAEDNTAEAITKLQNFINHVEAQRNDGTQQTKNKKIPAEDADKLIEYAQTVIDSL